VLAFAGSRSGWRPARQRLLGPAREASTNAVAQIVEAAHRDGSLSEEVTFAAIGLMLVRLARPLPGPFPPELNDELAHRHLDLLINGLRQKGRRGKALRGLSQPRRPARAARPVVVR
jgi:hypothetical protein